jgi:hypothetical protein
MNARAAVCWLVSFLALLVAAGCASHDGRGLVPGQATEAQVVARMGTPAQTLERADGGKVLYFSRLPLGRDMYAATIAPDGTLRGIEQRLNYENIARIVPKSTTKSQVRELLGPPFRAERSGIRRNEVWEYPWQVAEDRRILWLEFTDDGVVSEVIEMHDYMLDPPSGPGERGD